MKNKVLIAVLTLLAFSTLSMAQVKDNQRPPKSPEERAEILTKRLSRILELSSEQSIKVGEINKRTALEIETVRKEVQSKREKQEKIDRKPYLERIKALNEQRDQQIITLLNEQQKAEFIKLRTEQEERRKKRQEMRRKGRKKDTGMWPDEDFFLEDDES